jgi:arginine N-succinyltransferase
VKGPPVTLFRLARPDDADAIYAFTSLADAGLTTVPKSVDQVAAYIAEAQDFLVAKDGANRLLFVAEDAGKILGISGIIPKLGLERPFYSFKRSRHARKASQREDLSVRYDTLQLTTDFDDYTELASIFLAPEARGRGIARLLSLGRLGYIQAHRDRFADRLMADIRGWVDTEGNSPFWEHLTSKFIQTDFDIADRLSATDARFIVELLPALPILLNLLPDSAGASAGRPHDLSKGAMNLLLSAGFETTDLCDIFDGGPAIDCRTDRSLIAQTMFQATGSGIKPSDTDLKYLHWTGEGADFRATLGPAYPDARKAGEDACLALDTTTPIVALAQSRRAL